MCIGSIGSHIGIVTASVNALFLSNDLRLSGVTVLSDNAALVCVDKDLRSLSLLLLIAPCGDLINIDLGIRIYGKNAKSESVDT